ncbi:hypothetical protein PILCRDRAFT_17358 [Piloderma croceum F 1598]|uniref:Uncharacterized protein n=1 Tax=Piloderma croceum (strain F 1598) TaxID=765440 RepID=A0A0C3ABH9_PILCF|nr:hypothetical protein PILCRDRAFT_17358 [Piloderma croceum F 1598]
MSIMKRSRATISLVSCLMSWVSRHAPHEAQVLELVGDVFRFARSFAQSIEEHPLLVYMAASPMTPTSTVLYRTFHDSVLHPSVLEGFQQSSLARMIAIRVWDWVTASAILELREHDAWVTAVSCSPNNALLVSGSDDTTVRVWDMMTGAAISVLRGHDNCVYPVTFSPDGTKIVSGSNDSTIQI